MAPDFSKINDPKIAELLQKQPYFEILSDNAKQNLIDKLAKIPEDKKPEAIELLEKQAATLPQLTDQEKIAILEGETENLQAMAKNFKKETLEKGESIDKEESQKTQDQLLKELDNL